MKLRRNTPKIIGLSIANAIVLLLVCYFVDNWRFSLLNGPSVGQRIEQLKEIGGLGKEYVPEDYVFINISYDKELVPVYDEYGLPEGVMDITDRSKLTEFLSQLDNKHKYVMMDVLLDNRYRSDSDSSLTETILKNDRVGIARSATADLIDKRLIDKSGFIDYSTDIYETNFVKYEFLKDEEETLPYKIYLSENSNGEIKSFGPFYFKDGNLAWKSLTLRFPIKLWNETIHNEGNLVKEGLQEKLILNLGRDALAMDIPSLVKDKIVVIGDFFEDDIHDTYLGKIAGPVINVNALEALRNNELVIPWWLVIFLIIFYGLTTYYILLPKGYNNLVNKLLNHKRLQNKFIQYLLSFVGFSAIFTIVAGAIYLIFGMDINVFIPSLWFTFLYGLNKHFLNNENKNNSNTASLDDCS